MSTKFGPAGLGGVKEAISNLERYSELGLKACEIAFTYSIYIKRKEDALEIGKAAKKLGIDLSIHAPYWINLNSTDKKIIEKSKQRILKCCEIGTYLKAEVVVFHPGYYSKMSKQETYQNPRKSRGFSGPQKADIKEQAFCVIKRGIFEMQKEIKKKKYLPKLAPETTGKLNVFGSIDEIQKLVKDTGCCFCIDFAHILARYKDYKFKEVFEKFREHKKMHIHFSGIEYGKKGEKHHKKTESSQLKKLISNLPKKKEVTIINESPFPVEDSVLGLKIYQTLSKI